MIKDGSEYLKFDIFNQDWSEHQWVADINDGTVYDNGDTTPAEIHLSVEDNTTYTIVNVRIVVEEIVPSIE